MATRNRPAEFCEALRSVTEQSCAPDEIVVVDDGSAEDHTAAYRSALERCGREVIFHQLPARDGGHGGAFSLNVGCALAKSEFLCFLDDDDIWTDLEFLRRARAVVGDPEPVDLFFSNQSAFLRGQLVSATGWIEGLTLIVKRDGIRPDAEGAYSVSVDQLMRCAGFCHTNTTIIRRELFQSIGAFDENIRWEYDRDLYLRAIDRARNIKYSPKIVARHNVPDPSMRSNITTSTTDLEKRLFQIRVTNRAILLTKDPAIHKHAKQHKAYTLRKLAIGLAIMGKHSDAAYYAREALGAKPTFKWMLYTAWRMLRAVCQ